MFTAVAMFLMLVFFSSWFSTTLKRKIVGFGLLTDITIHATLQFMFGGTGEERIALLFAGLMFNTLMHLYRAMSGYYRFTFKGWKFVEPKGIKFNKFTTKQG